MSTGVKAVLYVLLSIGTLVFGVLAYSNVKRGIAFREAAAARRLDRAADTGTSAADNPAESVASTIAPPATNDVASATNTNTVSTNAGLATFNQVLAATNVTAALTNLAATITTNANPTNESAATAAASNQLAQASGAKATAKKPVLRDAQGHEILTPPKHMGVFLGLLILSALGLGILTAYDISQFTGNRALKVLYNDNLEGMKAPEYDEAEAEWANGNHLEAVRMMRDYLTRNPREQHVALRIAEIYEKDLNNFLAAALEYEEVLKQKLAPERWGWAAIHLCNLYFKLGHDDKAIALLKRIDSEYGQTAAAEKARKRMEQMNIPTSLDETAAAELVAEESKPVVEEKGPKLPPGFTLKKH